MKLLITERMLIAILIIAVILLAGYIGVDKYNGYMVGTMQNAYVAGYQDGVGAAVGEIVAQSQSCNPVPLYTENVTTILIDVACLQEDKAEND
jgi:hypothetical protein